MNRNPYYTKITGTVGYYCLSSEFRREFDSYKGKAKKLTTSEILEILRHYYKGRRKIGQFLNWLDIIRAGPSNIMAYREELTDRLNPSKPRRVTKSRRILDKLVGIDRGNVGSIYWR